MILNWLLLGAAGWLLAVVLKIVVDVAVQRSTKVELSDWSSALLSGAWSTLCELGVAALAFWYWQATLYDAIAFAVGVALVEFLLLLPAAYASNVGGKKKSKDPSQVPISWRIFGIERGVAFTGHLASRVLVWIGLAGAGGIEFAGAAFGLYFISEALAAYGEARDWNWLSPRVMWPILIFQTLIVVATATLAVWWFVK